MHGTIPSEIGLLTEMDIIIMAEINHLTSTIPSEVGTMSSLRFFFAGNNQLTGSLPTEFGLLRDKRLSWIHVQDNFLTGSFPSFLLSNMTRIGELNLTRNLFTGSIPTEIGWMTNLYRLQLSHNSFTGSIPSEMWTGPRQWRILSLGGNPELTGTIPDSLCYQAGNNTLELEFDCTGHLCGCNCSCLVT